MKNVVIATGGGVVLNEQNIENLRKTGVIFNLSPDFSVIRERLEEARKTRPLLKQDSIENIKKDLTTENRFMITAITKSMLYTAVLRVRMLWKY